MLDFLDPGDLAQYESLYKSNAGPSGLAGRFILFRKFMSTDPITVWITYPDPSEHMELV